MSHGSDYIPTYARTTLRGSATDGRHPPEYDQPTYCVPDWQRSYSWRAEEIETFWQDLLAFDARYPGENIVGEEYFLGSAVLVTGGATNLLLDGQQRLATATILLSVLRDQRRDFRDDAATRLQNKYISDYDDATGTRSYVVTLNAYDREFFRAAVQDDPATIPPTATLRSHALISRARQYFADKLSAEALTAGGGRAAFQRNLRIQRVLCDHMSVVAVSSTDEDNAAEVFDTLNDRGIGLSTPDLLRNLLIRRAPDSTTRNRIVAAWQDVLEINDEASVEDFIRHYWVSHYGDVRARKLYREIKGRVVADDRDSLELSLDIADAASTYRDIVRARDDQDPELRRCLEGIRALGAKVLYPALLSAYACGDSEEARAGRRELARALITMFVRYNVIGGRETTVMESAVFSAAAGLRADGQFASATAAMRAISPDAREFVARFQRASVSRIATVRYLLKELEHAKRHTHELAMEAPDRVHVEHIYPQNPDTDRWPGHARVVNRLGNLTLLSKRLNTSIKNDGFAAKKEPGVCRFGHPPHAGAAPPRNLGSRGDRGTAARACHVGVLHLALPRRGSAGGTRSRRYC